jgi:hypothetical protein
VGKLNKNKNIKNKQQIIQNFFNFEMKNLKTLIKTNKTTKLFHSLLIILLQDSLTLKKQVYNFPILKKVAILIEPKAPVTIEVLNQIRLIKKVLIEVEYFLPSEDYKTFCIIICMIKLIAMVLPILFIVIVLFGHGNDRFRSAFLFFLYTLAGSLPMLLSILYIYSYIGSTDFQIISLYEISLESQKILWLSFPFSKEKLTSRCLIIKIL